MERVRAYLEKQREPSAVVPVVRQDWENAKNPPLARKVATALRKSGHPQHPVTLRGQGIIQPARQAFCKSDTGDVVSIPVKLEKRHQSDPPVFPRGSLFIPFHDLA
ncbi:hypothetical protein ABIB85_008309 [Bradyrhizobium sp. JR1.5]|uniref:hypothetical protein n=1 Tax=unclassified Bradyrhizobium TaxID=2631580 RepID=UPI00339AAA2D